MQFIVRAWYENKRWVAILSPLAALYSYLAARRKAQYLSGHKTIWNAPVPVIIVGNISVGGSGKTPLVIALVEQLKQAGYKPGIVSRGYGAATKEFPRLISTNDSPTEVGDEPLLLAQRTQCPVVIDPNRVGAAQYILAKCDCDVLISDDGMQHYALGRDIEIAVVDAARGFGNQKCLPAGPLREPVERLEQVDFIVYNGKVTTNTHQAKTFPMQLVPNQFVSLKDASVVDAVSWTDSKQVQGVAGIGNPARFFSTLRTLGFDVEKFPFPDHHRYRAADFSGFSDQPVLMTEKDAVKCDGSWFNNGWFLRVSAALDEQFTIELLSKLSKLSVKK
ncbi:MAG: tetraacyldisaccharide 4'-kinase [Pseudomonadales bacterium]|nr:tetraacyldisaccharide 4'-kinase [Pseudomonadales bacterium]